MALDDVVSSTYTGPRVEEAMYRTLRWIDRCIAAHKNSHKQVLRDPIIIHIFQNLFGIVQGGLDLKLRDICLEGLIARGDKLPGYAVGGLSGGESKDSVLKKLIIFY